MLLRMIGSLAILAGAAATAPAQPAASKDKTPMPTVVLIGDSIRMGYAPLVEKRLAGRARVVSATANGGESANVLRHLDEWAIREQPAVVHFNCGLHDLKISRQTKRRQVEPGVYEANLREIVGRLGKQTAAAVIFANTTPVLDARHATAKSPFDLFEADVHRYNAVAEAAMKQTGVPVNDLHAIVEQGDAARLLGPDGVHYTPAGKELLADAVADAVLRQLAIQAIARHFRGHGSAPATAEAVARYRQAEQERDAQVPAAFRNVPVGKLAIPKDAAEWSRQRPAVLRAVCESLGDLPPRPSPQRVRRVGREIRRDYVLERVAIDNGVDSQVTALVLIPERRAQPAPAILWLHSSTPDKNHLLVPNENGGGESLADAFVRAGYVVVAPDAYSYGDRADSTPGGPAEAYQIERRASYRLAEDSMVKYNLWLGRTLWGMMVRDDQIALDYLCSRPEVDKSRVGATGMSMGSTRSWWLAAVDARVAAAVGVACMTRYQNLIAHGELRAHGPYYFVYGLLKHFDTEGVYALIAPRPFLSLTGDLDRGSPVDGIRVIEDRAGAVYRAVGADGRFKSIVYANTGHVYSPQMRAEMLAWFDRWLKAPSPAQGR